ncbi:MAG TPA: SRPBCC domain-containing protein [Hyphomonadaceae bacterium]|nr:SRPBCC domain-containing protein [Hyphomonadaceae bacterium]
MKSDTGKMVIEAERADEATIIMTRMFDAPIEKVWECFTRPEHVAVWFGGVGFTNRIQEMDVRPGGKWRQVMIPPSGQEYQLDFVYVEVKKPTRLVWQTSDFGHRKAGPPANRTEVTLAAQGDKTRWRMVATFQSLAERDFAKSMGYTNTLTQGCEKFNELVKTL